MGRFTNSNKWRAPEAPDLKIRKIYFYQKLRKKETKVIKQKKDKGKKEKETRKEEKKNHDHELYEVHIVMYVWSIGTRKPRRSLLDQRVPSAT